VQRAESKEQRVESKEQSAGSQAQPETCEAKQARMGNPKPFKHFTLTT